MFSFSFPPVSNFSVFFTCSLSFVSFFSVFLLGGIYRGKRERDRPYPCPIVAHGESGLPALSRCGARWPIGVACMAWPPGFSSEARRNKEEKTKNLSSPIARLGEEKGGTMSLKMTLFFFNMKRRCFGQNALFYLNKNVAKTRQLPNQSLIHPLFI